MILQFKKILILKTQIINNRNYEKIKKLIKLKKIHKKINIIETKYKLRIAKHKINI